MRLPTDKTSVGVPLALLPILFGFMGLIASASYQAQREGLFLHSFYPLDRFIQHHLDAIYFFAMSAALLGIAIALIIFRVASQHRLVKAGLIFSVLVLLLTLLGLSL